MKLTALVSVTAQTSLKNSFGILLFSLTDFSARIKNVLVASITIKPNDHLGFVRGDFVVAIFNLCDHNATLPDGHRKSGVFYFLPNSIKHAL